MITSELQTNKIECKNDNYRNREIKAGKMPSQFLSKVSTMRAQAPSQ